jgi:DNA-binding GntR family transcriptional regulator
MISRSINEQIYNTLKAEILDQRICFGQKLINRELQARFEVSSTPVRDAINRLQVDGLVDTISRSGAQVISFDSKMALEVNEVISSLNCEAVSLSFVRAKIDEVIKSLQIIIDQQIKLKHTDEYFIYDRLFHQVFFDNCNNEYLKKIYLQHNVLWELLVRYYYKDQASLRESAIEEHGKIVKAYMDGDIDLAKSYMSAHFQGAVTPLTKMRYEIVKG